MVCYIWEQKRWPEFTWRDKELLLLLSRCRKRQGEFLGFVLAMGIDLTNEARAEVLTAEAVQTSLIEGEELNITAVRSSVANQLGLPFAGIPIIDRNADGLVRLLIDGTPRFSRPANLGSIRSWSGNIVKEKYRLFPVQ